MARTKLAALRTRRVNAAAQREQLAISLAQRAGEIDQLWAEHQALRAAIHRTCKEFDRVMANIRATRAANPEVELARALGGQDRRSGALLAPVPLRRRPIGELQASEGLHASAL